jgi:hypothetical protein
MPHRTHGCPPLRARRVVRGLRCLPLWTIMALAGPAAAQSPPAPGADARQRAGAVSVPDGPAGALADALRERRVFRHVLVGALRYPPRRLTWVLSRGATQVRLQVFCQLGKPSAQSGISLTGQENDESMWRDPVVTTYAGARSGKDPQWYALSIAGVPGDRACEALPDTLQLRCRADRARVLRAGAALVPGKKRADDRMSPPRWQPPGRDPVAALRCDLSVDGAWPLRQVPREWPLVFVPARDTAPGIEWAHENSDMAVQEGAYRWMPSPE